MSPIIAMQPATTLGERFVGALIGFAAIYAVCKHRRGIPSLARNALSLSLTILVAWMLERLQVWGIVPAIVIGMYGALLAANRPAEVDTAKSRRFFRWAAIAPIPIGLALALIAFMIWLATTPPLDWSADGPRFIGIFLFFGLFTGIVGIPLMLVFLRDSPSRQQ